MLLEALVYALSIPATPAAFRPHLGDAIGLWARGRRQRLAWHAHLLATATAVEALMPAVPGTGTVVVLGSGALFDVPLAALSRHFRQVLLVDRAHLVGARLIARRYANAAMAWRDLSVASVPDPLGFLAEVPDLGWVVSLNLLSQLAYGAPEGQERRVIEAHLAGLAALPCPATLVTDLSYDSFARDGRRLEHFDLLYGRQLPSPTQRWSWEVAPFGEESAASRRVHEVGVYPDWRQAAPVSIHIP